MVTLINTPRIAVSSLFGLTLIVYAGRLVWQIRAQQVGALVSLPSVPGRAKHQMVSGDTIRQPGNLLAFYKSCR